jgi:type II secretory pathway pseudopilin PulG
LPAVRHWRTRARRGGFSFTEVMFAVIILGIGFIMLAALFPVAISQNKLTADETTAASIARTGTNFLTRIASDALMPSTVLIEAPPAATAGTPPTVSDGTSVTVPGKVLSFRDPRMSATLRTNLWNAVRGDLILSSDPRYAWIPLYRRDRTYTNPAGAAPTVGSDAPYAQVFVIGVQVRSGNRYDSAHVADTGDPQLVPRLMQATLTDGGAGIPDTIRFTDPHGSDELGTVGPGMYVVISNDRGNGAANGRIYRVGNPTNNNANEYELMPGGDMASSGENLTDVDVLVVGRQQTTPGTAGAYEGNVQDIAIYTTFVPVN